MLIYYCLIFCRIGQSADAADVSREIPSDRERAAYAQIKIPAHVARSAAGQIRKKAAAGALSYFIWISRGPDLDELNIRPMQREAPLAGLRPTENTAHIRRIWAAAVLSVFMIYGFIQSS